ncbi:hypothetical protein RXP24_29860, partial [Pseudomonas aeruginosa]|nr:hypothetical protein [Pseudomonas aeruginosa]
MRRLARVLFGVVALLLVAGAALWYLARAQGKPSHPFPYAKVFFDSDDIPTIEASDWNTVIEAQGFVVAS